MVDDIAAVGTTPAGRTWATILGFILEAFFCTIIALILRYGDQANSLHKDGLGWSFAGAIGIAASLGLSQIATVYIAVTAAKKA